MSIVSLPERARPGLLALPAIAFAALALHAPPTQAALAPAAPAAPAPHPQFGSSPAQAADACARLTELDLPDVQVKSGESITPAPSWEPPDLMGYHPPVPISVTRPFCRVRGAVEGDIDFELWLPTPADWTGRFYGIGNGGFAGFFRFEELARGISRGLASMSTDTGHRNTELDWARNHPRRLENFAFRGMHLVTVAAKAIVAAYYGKPAAHAYFMGCSGGGMQAVNEASRYPADYDGVVAGAHGMSYPAIQTTFLLSSKPYQGAGFVTEDDWKAIAAAAVRQCGDANGVILDPQACHFDVASTPGLSPQKIANARMVMAPIRDADGEVLFDGLPPGVALHPILNPTEPVQLFGDWLHHDPHWSIKDFHPAQDIVAADALIPGISLVGADLTLFARRGGRIIGYDGTLDAGPPAAATIRYYQGVARRQGAAQTASFARLFVLPGVRHCGNGPGPDVVGGMGQPDPTIIDPHHDMLSAIEAWVEDGQAPDYLIASRVKPGPLPAERKILPTRLDGSGPR